MKTRTIGIVMIILGIIMLLYTSFNYVTTEKVVDIGPIQINKEVNHPIKWSPIIGIILAVGGVVLIVVGTKKEA
jgi:drug/metabolite transporter (DMT)-like permease